MEEQKVLFELINGIRADLVWTFAKLLLVAMVILSIRNCMYMLIEYFTFKANNFVSIGAIVKVDDFVGRIKSIRWDYITIEGEEGNLLVHTRSWSLRNWIFLNTTCDLLEKKDQNPGG